MDPLLALLDREILQSAAAHDLRGACTTLGAVEELGHPSGRLELELLGLARDRVLRVAQALADLPRPGATSGDLAWALGLGQGVWVCGGASFGPLRAALDRLPHATPTLGDEGGTVLLTVPGLPREEVVNGWNLSLALEWLAEGAPRRPGLAGARLSAAARVAGASRLEMDVWEGGGRLRARFMRGLSPGGEGPTAPTMPR